MLIDDGVENQTENVVLASPRIDAEEDLKLKLDEDPIKNFTD